ncbi:hypothetical protein D9M68_735350 [compost metagenome]
MPYVDRNLINNSSLACFLLVNFIKQYEEASVEGGQPDLLKLLLVLPFAWHETSRKSIKNRNFSTLLDNVLQEEPLIKANLKRRVSSYSGATIQGLNLATASGLIKRISTDDQDRFSTNFVRWPSGIKTALPDEMTKTTKRLANWFCIVDTPTLYKALFGDQP